MDTIVASASAWGRCAIAVLRLSGPQARMIVELLCPGGAPWRERRASLRRAIDGEVLIDQVLVLWMPGPRSYTGEDVVELSCHGNPVIQQQLMDRMVALGARIARPGEFTRRAVVHGRMDLIQAEAVAVTIDAGSMDGVLLAQKGLDGALSAALAEFREELLEQCAELEARLDHPGEDLGIDSDRSLGDRIGGLEERARALAESWRAGRVRVGGARVSLVGSVNAGKSSLFNSLVGRQRALVSDVAGTTRDVVESTVILEGLEITFLDTAGRRLSAEEPVGELEAAGIALGMELSEQVDLEVWVHRLDQPLPVELPESKGRARLVVGTHLDLASSLPGVDCAISNTQGDGLDSLRQAIREHLQGPRSGEQVALFSQRQYDLVCRLAEHTDAARGALLGELGPAVAAEEVHGALQRLAELSGGDPREEVLDRLFSRFCIGK